MAYPNAPDFSSPDRNAAWYTSVQDRQICTTGAGNFLRDLNTRLSAVFGADVSSATAWRSLLAGVLAGPVGAALGAYSAPSLPSGPTWTPATFAYLYLAMRQWYGDQNPYVQQIATAYRSGAITRDVLRAAVWLTYHTTNGVAEVRSDGGRGLSTQAPRELVPISSIEIKGNTALPVSGRELPVLSGSRSCQDAPDDRDPSLVQGNGIQIAGTQVSFVTLGVAVLALGGVAWWLYQRSISGER